MTVNVIGSNKKIKMKSKHPQAPPFENNQEIEAFLARPLLARLASHNDDGTIHIAPLYFKYERGEFIFGTQEVSRKVQNIKRDQKVTVIIDTDEPELQSVMAYGDAKLDYENVISKRVEILERYYDTEAEAKALAKRLAKAWKLVIIRLKPTRIVSIDYSKPFLIE